MGTWTNSDGLYLKFGTDEAKLAKGGVFADTDGSEHTAEIVLSGATATYDFGAVGTETIASDTIVIPAGARITSATLYVETAFTSGGSATLIVGTIRTDRSTTYDDNGFIASTAVGSLTAAATITGSGALVNTTLANDALITTTVGTAAFTAGKGILKIKWYMPRTNALA
jgi:hypothetical protein